MTVEKRVVDRFWSKVNKSNDCWLWMKAKTSDGYGAWSFPVNGKFRMMRAHRFAYLVTNGSQKNDELHHLCENKICVRPDHLKDVTRKEHMNVTPGTYGYKWAHRTHCENKHELSGDNLLPWALKRGWRKCRACSIEKSRVWRTANPEKMKNAVRNWQKKNHARKYEYDRWYNETVRGHTPRNSSK